jgi:hypothetical protein
VTGYSTVVSPPYKLRRDGKMQSIARHRNKCRKLKSTKSMEPVIIALAEAIWPALELQAAEQSACDAAALAHYLSLSGAEMKQVPQEVRASRNACTSMLLGMQHQLHLGKR